MIRRLLKRIGYTVLVLAVLLNVMAAFHAYKFTHFYSPETNSRSFTTMDAGFWDKASAIVFGIKSYRKPIDSIPPLFDTLQLTTSDGLRLQGWVSSTAMYDSQLPKGTMILLHGHGSNKAGVLTEAGYFLQLGYRVLLLDFRAHGNSEGNTCTIGYEEVKDVKAAYDYVRQSGEKNIIIYGISMGAATAMKAVHDYQLQPSKMILEMPFGTLKDAVKGRCRILGVPVEPTSTLLTFWGGLEQGFWAFNYQPALYAKSITCPVLLQWGEKDNRVTRAETDAVYAGLASNHKQLVIYHNAGHQSLATIEPRQWQEFVTRFLQ